MPGGKTMSSFEERLAKLEHICESMNSDELPLAEGLRLYEEGVRITKALEKELVTVERKVEQLVNDDFTDTSAEPRLQLFEERAAAVQSEPDSPQA